MYNSSLSNQNLHTALVHFKLDFEEMNLRTNKTFKVVFYPEDVLLNDDQRIVFEGLVELGGHPGAKGRIMFHKELGTFHRVRYSKHTTKTNRIGAELSITSHPVVLEELMRAVAELCVVTESII